MEWRRAPEPGPVETMARRLQVGPPSLARIIEILNQGEDLREFVWMVREFLPQYEREILDGGPNLRAFWTRFEQEYFPLDIDDIVTEGLLEEFVRRIPIYAGGISYTDYHELNFGGPGHTLALALVNSPYGDERGHDAARVALLEEAARIAGDRVVQRIPQEGYPLDHLHSVLDGTPYEGVACLGDILWQQTDTVMLDANYEDYDNDFCWCREHVDRLTREWPRVQRIQDQVEQVTRWLLEDPEAHLREVLNHIEGIPPVPREQLPLPLIFEGEEDGAEAVFPVGSAAQDEGATRPAAAQARFP